VPEFVLLPGVLVMVHVPDEGKPLNATLPVATEHVGCVTAPVMGVEGDEGWALITTLAVAEDVQPNALVTVKL
jgi:hypothetical protein